MRKSILVFLVFFAYTFIKAQTTLPSLEPLKESVEKLTQELNKLNKILNPEKKKEKEEIVCGIISLKDERLIVIKTKDKAEKEIKVRSDEMKKKNRKFDKNNDITKYKLILVKDVSLKIAEDKITDVQITYMYNVNGIFETNTSSKKYTSKQSGMNLPLDNLNASTAFTLTPNTTEYIYLNDILDYDDSLQPCIGVNIIVLLSSENTSQKITK